MDTRPSRDDARARDARERRLIVFVEAYLRTIRDGPSSDPEPILRASGDLRTELEPLLAVVARLEEWALGHGGSGARD